LRAGFDQIPRIAELHALCLLGREGASGPIRDEPSLLLGERRVEVEHEGVSIGAKFDDDEGHALRHQAGDERDIARQPVELGDDNRALIGFGGGERCGKLWPAVEGICAFAAFGLDELPDHEKALGERKALDCGALGLQAKPGAALAIGGNAIINDGFVHRSPPERLYYKWHTTVWCLYDCEVEQFYYCLMLQQRRARLLYCSVQAAFVLGQEAATSPYTALCQPGRDYGYGGNIARRSVGGRRHRIWRVVALRVVSLAVMIALAVGKGGNVDPQLLAYYRRPARRVWVVSAKEGTLGV
jgi:hypothetical protein